MTDDIGIEALPEEDAPAIELEVEVQDSVSVKDAEAWAVGQRGGVDVVEGDPTYHNNAKYHAGQAAGSAEDAEAWAEGTRGGTPIGSSDPVYQKDAKTHAGEAEDSAEDAEAWAEGTRGGTPIGSSDPVYRKDAKTHAGEAEDSAEDAEAWAEGTRGGTPIGSSDPVYQKDAKTHAGEAEDSAEDAEAWAIGKRGGVDVPSTDPAYHNSAKYHAEQAGSIIDDTAGDGATGKTWSADKLSRLIDDDAGETEKRKTWSAAKLSGLQALVTKAVHLYGVLWDQTNAQMTRIWDAADITTTTTNFTYNGSENANYDNPFDDLYPWSGRKCCNVDIEAYMAWIANANRTGTIEDLLTFEGETGFAWDSADGVWVYTPEFWYTYYEREDGKRVIGVADGEVPGWIHQKAYIGGRYWGVDTVRSIDSIDTHILLPTAGEPINNIDSAVMHTYAKNMEATLDNYLTESADNALYLVEFANWNSQAKLGNGPVNAVAEGTYHPTADTTNGNVIQIDTANAGVFAVGRSISIGTTKNAYNTAQRAILASETDSVDATKTNITISGDPITITTAAFLSVHGVANPAGMESAIGSKSGYVGTNGWANAFYRGKVSHGNRWRYCLGLFHEKTTRHVWKADEADFDSYDAIDTSAHHDTGIAVSTTEGFIQKLALIAGAGPLGVCTAVGGNNANPVGDYYYTANGDTVFRFGGCAYANSSSRPRPGRFSGDSYRAASSAYWNYSARPLLKNP